MSTPLVMEPICIEGRITGAAVIDDLCGRIAERLARNGDLRTVDSYSSYSARVTIELSLQDVDVAKVSEQITVGQLPPAPQPAPTPSQPQPIRLDIKPVVASMVVERQEALPTDTLERCVDGSVPEPHPFVQPSLERMFDGSEPTVIPQPEPPAGKKYAAPKWATSGSRAAPGHDDGLTSK
jgi:hypothetical protein